MSQKKNMKRLSHPSKEKYPWMGKTWSLYAFSWMCVSIGAVARRLLFLPVPRLRYHSGHRVKYSFAVKMILFAPALKG